MASPDTISALIAYLSSYAEVASLVGTDPVRIYGDGLPLDAVKNIDGDILGTPRPSITLSKTAGFPAFAHMDLDRQRVDIRCYGENPYEADNLHRTVHLAMKHIERLRIDGMLIHSTKPQIGGMVLLDPDTDWPNVFSSWEVLIAEVPAPTP